MLGKPRVHVDNSAELPAYGQHQLSAVSLRHLGHPAQADLQVTEKPQRTSSCNPMRNPTGEQSSRAFPEALTQKIMSEVQWLLFSMPVFQRDLGLSSGNQHLLREERA